MTAKRYIVMPGVEWVAGYPAPSDRVVYLTSEAATYDLALGRIYSDGSAPPGPIDVPALVETDLVRLDRGGISHVVSMADLAGYLRAQGVGGPFITLSQGAFALGTAKDAELAAITVPDGWRVEAETSFGGRVRLQGSKLFAAQAFVLAASGSIRLRITSPDGLVTLTQSFALRIGDGIAPLPPLPDLTPVTAAILTTAAAGSVVLDLPPLVEGETRRFVLLDSNAPDPRLAISTAGDLLVGVSALAEGSIVGRVAQTRDALTLYTTVTITVAEPDPVAPSGFVFLAGADGVPLVGADGALLYAKVI